MSLNRLDEEFTAMLIRIQSLALKFDKHSRIRIQQWTKKLSGIQQQERLLTLTTNIHGGRQARRSVQEDAPARVPAQPQITRNQTAIDSHQSGGQRGQHPHQGPPAQITNPTPGEILREAQVPRRSLCDILPQESVLADKRAEVCEDLRRRVLIPPEPAHHQPQNQLYQIYVCKNDLEHLVTESANVFRQTSELLKKHKGNLEHNKQYIRVRQEVDNMLQKTTHHHQHLAMSRQHLDGEDLEVKVFSTEDQIQNLRFGLD